MFRFLSSIITSADITDEQKQATQRMLRNILFTVIATSVIISFVDGIIFKRLPTLYALGSLAVISIISLYYLQRRIFWPARVIIPLGALIAISYIVFIGNGMHDVGISSFGIVIILAGLTLGGNALIVFGILSALAITIIGIAEMNGYIAYPFGTVAVSDIIIISVAILAGAFLLRLLLNRLQQTIVELQQSEREQLKANAELIGLKESLENRVAERTAELSERGLELEIANTQIRRRASQFEALAQVTQTITSIRDLRELLPLIANVISERFGFYHVGIFLLDEVGQYAILGAANSEGGKRMLERKHRLRVGEEGIVGHAAATGRPRIAMDVGTDAVFFNNPDLPNTHSEMALPLISKNIIVGVLDVQSTEVAAFTQEDVQMLSLLADQVSLAIENARLFDETRKALGESEAISRQITRESFGRLSVEQKLVGYQYNVAGARPLEAPVQLTGTEKGRGRQKQTGTSQILVPIELRGETIGMLAVQSPSLSAMSQDQIDLIKAVADRVALSAENARLFEETSRRAEREKMVSDITGKIRSVNDPELMIKTAMEELRNALGASRVEVIPQAIKGSE